MTVFYDFKSRKTNHNTGVLAQPPLTKQEHEQ